MECPRRLSLALCYSMFFVNYLDESVDGRLISSAADTKLGGIANMLDGRVWIQKE